MFLIPTIRTTRAISSIILFPNNPICAVAVSEIGSYIIPFVNNSPFSASNDMILFLFYYFYYNKDAIEIINKFKNRYILNYYLELFMILLFITTKI